MTDISARTIADSISPRNKRLTSMEVEFPRFILAEFSKHRMLSFNTSSSRAIPVKKMIEHVDSDPAHPYYWGKNRAGMSADEEISDPSKGMDVWEAARNDATYQAELLNGLGVHKQITNRLLEPFQWVKMIVTATEWENFFYLRRDKAAQPEIRILADKMYEAMRGSYPFTLRPGDWHLPYYREGFWVQTDDELMVDKYGVSLQDAIKISVSCSAQTSYRKNDDSLEKANNIFDMLHLGDENERSHSTPAEHQATPMTFGHSINDPLNPVYWEKGVTAYHAQLGMMSGNLAGWIQYRQTIPYHTKWKEDSIV